MAQLFGAKLESEEANILMGISSSMILKPLFIIYCLFVREHFWIEFIYLNEIVKSKSNVFLRVYSREKSWLTWWCLLSRKFVNCVIISSLSWPSHLILTESSDWLSSYNCDRKFGLTNCQSCALSSALW